MTIQTLRPNATVAAGSFTATGAASLWQATSDNSDASYAQASAINSAMVLDVGSYTLLAGERVRTARFRQRHAGSAGGSTSSTTTVQDSSVGGLGGVWMSVGYVINSSTPATVTAGWVTPPEEVTQTDLNALRFIVFQSFTDGVTALRVHELYLDLDVRARPVINSFSATPSGDVVTFDLAFTYGTSAIAETVTVSIEILDDQGAVVDTITQQVTGTDFASQAVVVPYSSSFGDFTARATVIAAGFPAPTTTYVSAVSEATYSIPASGVEPPLLTCTTDQAAQTVSIEICQSDNVLPPATDCLRIETFGTGAYGNQVSFSGGATEVVSAPDSAALDLTGNITVIVWARATDWTPAAVRTLFSKAPATSLTGYSANLQTSGLLNFVIGTGAAARTMASTAPGLTDGQGYWLEFFYDNTAKTCRFRKSSDPFYTATANISWTTISTSAAHAGGSPTANTNTLQVGALATTLQWVGAIGYLAVNDALGTNVAEADFRPRAVGSASFVDGSGNTWTFAGGTAVATNSVTVTTVGQPRHVALWINDTLTTADLVYGATSVTLDGDTVGLLALNSTVTPKLVVATTGGGATNVVLVAYPFGPGSGNIVHNFNTTNLIVQARVDSTSLQAEVGAHFNGVNQIFIDTVPEAVSVLVLAQVAADAVCVPTEANAVLAATQDQVFPHQFSSLLTMTTFVRTSDNRVSWVGVELEVGEVVVDNDGGAGTIHVSGYLAVWDDPDAVRAEVRRAGELISLDGLNGAIVPAFGEGCLTVTDRFPPRYPPPTCEGDLDPVGPTYEVRFYGYVDGVAAVSPWATCTPPAVLHNGSSLLRHPTDASLDVEGCTTNESWPRTRPQTSAQPVTGGFPAVRSGVPGGRDYTLILATRTTTATLALETLLNELFFWYSPIDPLLPAAWLTPGAQQAYTPAKAEGRPADVTVPTTETEPDPVLLPPPGPPAS